MDENYETLDLKTKLIVAGINELDTHGVEDFSIRRVAASCGVSCAAPYRHFKGKSELILEIIKHINSGWDLLQSQIESVYSDDIPTLITELSVALVRFRLANPEFRAVLTIDRSGYDEEQRAQISGMTEKILGYISEYYAEYGEEEVREKKYLFLSMIYGAMIIPTDDIDESLRFVRSCMRRQLDN